MSFHGWQSKSRRTISIAETFAVSAWMLSSAVLTVSEVAAYGRDTANSPGPAACARMADAMLMTAKTPYTSMSTIAFEKPQPNGPARKTSGSSQTIFTGDALFVKSGDGPWRRIDLAISALQDLVRKASARFADCRDLGSEQIEGSPVTAFYAYEGTPPSAYGAKTKLWVDKARGVLVRSETETTSDEGSRHSIIEYKYGSVTAPQL